MSSVQWYSKLSATVLESALHFLPHILVAFWPPTDAVWLTDWRTDKRHLNLVTVVARASWPACLFKLTNQPTHSHSHVYAATEVEFVALIAIASWSSQVEWQPFVKSFTSLCFCFYVKFFHHSFCFAHSYLLLSFSLSLPRFASLFVLGFPACLFFSFRLRSARKCKLIGLTKCTQIVLRVLCAVVCYCCFHYYYYCFFLWLLCNRQS